MKPRPSLVRGFLFLAFFAILYTCSGTTALAQDIQVTSADPPSAEQGTVNLNVTIKGKGFKKGAQAKWFVTGTTNPGGVTVNSTTFVKPTELVANIDIADTAEIASFDIEVQAADGRSGKGTELFSVVAKGDTSTAGGARFATTSEFSEMIADFGNLVTLIHDDSKGIYVDRRISTSQSDSCTGSTVGCSPPDLTQCAGTFLRPYVAGRAVDASCPAPASISKNTCEDVNDFKTRVDAEGVLRQLTLDFSVPVSGQNLSLCQELPTGQCEATQQFIRMWVDDLFLPDVHFTTVRLAIDQPRHQSAKGFGDDICFMMEFWELNFEKTLEVIEVDADTRIVRTVSPAVDPGGDVVQVFKVTWKGGSKKVESVGRFHMPMQVTIKKTATVVS